MWREFDEREKFFLARLSPVGETRLDRCADAANRCAVLFLEPVMNAAPLFYVALFVAYLAVSFGVIS